jgi:hypothetical protein
MGNVSPEQRNNSRTSSTPAAMLLMPPPDILAEVISLTRLFMTNLQGCSSLWLDIPS